MAAREDTINLQLGEVLQDLRPHSWRVLAEEQRTLRNSAKRPDVLIVEPAGWPVVIEAERENFAGAEKDAQARLGSVVDETGRPIESAIALVYPPEVRDEDGGQAKIRAALRATENLQYALYTAAAGGAAERLPAAGWLRGGVRDLAILAHRATTPAPRVERLSDALEYGVGSAAGAFERKHGSRLDGSLGAEIAALLGQSDDQGGQTRRMAMTVLVNALIFHAALAGAEFRVERAEGSAESGRRVRPLADFELPAGGYALSGLRAEWDAILQVNYWPIFATAKEILRKLPLETAAAVLAPLWKAAEALIQGGATRSHDLTGVIFQRLIADRKFLATFYTRPAAAALLAGLAIPAERAPGGADWADEETIASLQIGDFACGTGTLLSAAYQRISLLHELHGGDPQELHAPMMKNGLVGLDVLNIAVHLTAAMLAGSHPDVPFEGECLLTMPYGRWGEGKRDVGVGSLDLLAGEIQAGLIEQAAATTAGGRHPEDVRDLINRVGHSKFDLTIMNPPFTRPTNHEAGHADVPIPAYAAFDTSTADQRAMSQKVKILSKGQASNDYAGLASHFAVLANRKVHIRGTAAFVLPLSAASGGSWEAMRDTWSARFNHIIVVTIAAPGSKDRSFSADTGMAECLLILTNESDQSQSADADHRAFFVVLSQQPRSQSRSALIAQEIRRLLNAGEVAQIESESSGGTRIVLGEEDHGYIIDAPLDAGAVWPVVGVADAVLAQAAYQLERGRVPDRAGSTGKTIPIVPIGSVGVVGPVDRLIGSKTSEQRGAFRIEIPPLSSAPSFPTLWAHDAKRERSLQVVADAEGIPWNEGYSTDSEISKIWSTASRAHYNRDLQFNAQSIIVAITDQKCIGGMAWPSLIFNDPEHEYTFSLWCNSALGLLLHWWTCNKTQSGRGRTTVTSIPNIPTLDIRELDESQILTGKEAFSRESRKRLLPFDQIDEDPVRAEIDRAILVDVLGLPESLCDPDGPIDLLRRKLAREPQIHGGKKSRVVFTEHGETTQRRSDRG